MVTEIIPIVQIFLSVSLTLAVIEHH